MLSYPSDEVGNHLVDLDLLDEKNINPWSDVLTEETYRALFGYEKHVFTGVDYVEYYKQLIQEAGAEVEIILQIIQRLSSLILKAYWPAISTHAREQNES